MAPRAVAAAPLAALASLGCGEDEPLRVACSVEPGERVLSYAPAPASGIATGELATPALAYEAIAVDPCFSHQLGFQMTPMLPPTREPIASAGPLLLYSDTFETLVFSPLDHFFESVVELRDGRIEHGIQGEIDAIPEGFEHRFLLVTGSGVARTVARWGELLLADRGRAPVDRYADPGTSRLGYWTDNGAAYYYAAAAGMSERETLLAVKADAEARQIPLGYLQLDSWWYEKDGGQQKRGGVTRWEPIPEMFPDGLAAFQSELGLPLVLHNRWFAKQNAYRDDHEFVEGDEMALPLGRELFDRLMGDARGWGAVTYEQDWLMLQWWGVPWLRSGAGNAASWMAAMSGAAADAGLTMQLCMPGAAHLLDSVDRPNVTTARTSIDYAQGISKESFWPQFHVVNLVAAAVGLLPFKDNFRSAEKWGEAEALVSALSAGMVGPSDEIGELDRSILLRTCRSDGLLLKPDRPAVPIDAMLVDHERPFTVHTRSERAHLGTWSYVAAFHLASEHEQRTPSDEIFASIAYDGQPLEAQLPFPAAVRDWRVDLERDLGAAGPAVVYDWRAGTATLVERAFEMPPRAELYDHAYFVVAPILANGLALIGEPEKFVTLADRRFVSIAPRDGALDVELEGAPGERVTLLAYDVAAGRLLEPVVATIESDGTARVTIGRRTRPRTDRPGN